jgi:hypothetical protein
VVVSFFVGGFKVWLGVVGVNAINVDGIILVRKKMGEKIQKWAKLGKIKRYECLDVCEYK